MAVRVVIWRVLKYKSWILIAHFSLHLSSRCASKYTRKYRYLSAPVEVLNKLCLSLGEGIGILCQLQVILGKLFNSRSNEERDGACRGL